MLSVYAAVNRGYRLPSNLSSVPFAAVGPAATAGTALSLLADIDELHFCKGMKVSTGSTSQCTIARADPGRLLAAVRREMAWS
jgi:hypothetical protein